MTRNHRHHAAVGVLVSSLIALSCGESGKPLKQGNERPHITSALQTEAAGGIAYCYRLEFTDSDSPHHTVSYQSCPSWLTPRGDSACGTPPEGAVDTSFLAIVSDSLAADTVRVTVSINPTIVIYGDTRTDAETHRKITDLIMRRHPAAVFHTGDLVEDGTRESDWVTFRSIAAPLRAVAEFFPALGNHEKQSPLFFSEFDLPNNEQWYAVDRNQMRFIVLNSNAPADSWSAQFHWLDSTLSHPGDSTLFTILIFHHPPYSSGGHREDEMGLRRTIVPLFRRHGVEAVFNGHDHDYERLRCDDIDYVVAGGGGAPLYDRGRQLDCSVKFLKTYHFCKLSRVYDRLTVGVYDLGDTLIDRFEVQK
ncbi:MAG: metallophosphoesterase [candidate division Zixibacteria bacterium]|nr:metallophosphoesterase [candidate division Zixibacteria bacterium]